ncbi:MAG TPA: TetR/AcrR family transcriptional regulator [Thermoanaerobaculia bacterium]|nr:TetR/AcrR family transcriptional regulator [Thermoanaerobaculia bacterium]
MNSRHRRSEHTRRQVLDAALDLFSHQGYRATVVKEIAEAAGVSTGNLYHHFPDKEAVFRTLLEEYQQITTTPKFPLMRALSSGSFPNNLEQIANAARESVQQYRKYMVLHFVDVIEFDGTHIRKFYSVIADRLGQVVAEHPPRLRDGVSPQTALLVVARLFFNYFQLQILFGVSEPYGGDSGHVVREIADILLHGIV